MAQNPISSSILAGCASASRSVCNPAYKITLERRETVQGQESLDLTHWRLRPQPSAAGRLFCVLVSPATPARSRSHFED